MRKMFIGGLAGIVLAAGATGYYLLSGNDIGRVDKIDYEQSSGLVEPHGKNIVERIKEPRKFIRDNTLNTLEESAEPGDKEDMFEKEYPQLEGLDAFFAKSYFNDNFLLTVPQQLEDILKLYSSWRNEKHVVFLSKEDTRAHVGYKVGKNLFISESVNISLNGPVPVSYRLSFSHDSIFPQTTYGVSPQSKLDIMSFSHSFPRGQDTTDILGLVDGIKTGNRYHLRDNSNRSEVLRPHEGPRIHQSLYEDMLNKVVLSFPLFVARLEQNPAFKK